MPCGGFLLAQQLRLSGVDYVRSTSEHRPNGAYAIVETARRYSPSVHFEVLEAFS